MTTATAITLKGLRDLPPRLLIPEAGKWLGISRAKSYLLAQAGEFPCEVRKVGGRYYVLTSDLARALGIDPALLLEG
ncbi:hypothetical protein [Agromyces sp. NPDC055658]